MKKYPIINVCTGVLLAVSLMAGSFGAETVTEEMSEVTAEAVENSTESAVASSAEMVETEKVVEDWMVPIQASELNPGTYEVKVNSSSSMFSVDSCELTVDADQMTAVLKMGGTGYLYVYPGSGEEAAAAPEEDYIPFEEDEEGVHTFTIPVKALDEGFPCAAFSKRKEKWYDRTLAVLSTSLPDEAFREREVTTAEDLGLEDGTYTVEAALSGGSGRASIDSPAKLTVEGGEATLEVIFSSPNYDYMLVDGQRYEPVNTEGNSTFLIPVDGFDYAMSVTADTVAMSTPHEIDYQITLDSATIAEQP